MGVDVEEQEPKVSTEDLADKLSVKEDLKSQEQIQAEAEEELKVVPTEVPKEETEDEAKPIAEGTDSQVDGPPVALQESLTSQEGATPSRRAKAGSPFSFLSRLFRGSVKEEVDAETGTELLSKTEPSEESAIAPQEEKQEVTSSEPGSNGQTDAQQGMVEAQNDQDTASTKQEKSSPESDVTVQIVPDEKGNGSGEESTKKMFTSRFNSVRWRWILSAFLLFFIIFVLTGFLAAQLAYMPPEEGDGNKDTVPLAVTSCGPVLGVREDGVSIFRGIPYALPPVRERRWKPPFLQSQIEDCWQGTLLAQNESRHCWQRGHLDSGDLSEDCLTLNVMTPNLSYQKSLPVVVYMTGSSMLGLDKHDLSWQPFPQLSKEQGVVFVTFNYRMGLFGFMALDVLSKSVYPPTSGNYGFQDQLAVLKWVAKNIRHFGGDPDKVTLLAHGSAATAGLALASSKKSKGLFNQAWLTGGSAIFTDKSLMEVMMENTDFLKNTGCDSVSCLQEKSPMELMEALPVHWGNPTPLDLPTNDEEPVPALAVIDGAILFDQPANIWKEENVSAISIVLGSTAQESSFWQTDKNLSEWTWEHLTDYVTKKLDPINATLTERILDYYMDNSSTPEVQFHSMVSDVRVTCPLQDLAHEVSENAQLEVYSYVLTYKPSSIFNGVSTANPMASHGLDIIAILGLLDQYLEELSPLDLVYQSNIQDLFYSFVRSGKPASGDTELMGSRYVNLVAQNIVSSRAPYKNCDVWEDLKGQRFGRMN